MQRCVSQRSGVKKSEQSGRTFKLAFVIKIEFVGLRVVRSPECDAREEMGELMERTGPEEAIEAPKKSEQMHRRWTESSCN